MAGDWFDLWFLGFWSEDAIYSNQNFQILSWVANNKFQCFPQAVRKEKGQRGGQFTLAWMESVEEFFWVCFLPGFLCFDILHLEH